MAATRQDLFAGRRMLTVPAAWKPTLLVAVDTEEEFDWSGPKSPQSRAVTNVLSVPLLQAVFDRHGVRPVYLIDHPVTESPDAVAVLRRIAGDGRAEIGAHLHPWVNPPIEEALDARNAFACNLPPALERRKIEALTRAIQREFDVSPSIFRAGAYGVGACTPGILASLGYIIDSSVVPFTSFKGYGGPSFADLSPQPFRTVEGIIEIPLTSGFAGLLAHKGQSLFPQLGRELGRMLRLRGVAARLALLERLRLSPEGHAVSDMARLVEAGLARGERLFMMTLHSSSLLPGATRYVRTIRDRDAFLHRIDAFLSYFHHAFGGTTGLVSEVGAALGEQG